MAKGRSPGRRRIGRATALSQSPEKPRPQKPRLIVTPERGGNGQRVRLRIGEEQILLGRRGPEEVTSLRNLVRSRLHLWDDLLEVWVPTPSLLLRMTQAGAPDLSQLRGFRELGEFRPLVAPALDDPSLWTRTALGALNDMPLIFGVVREGAEVFWVLPLERRAFFKATPREFVATAPELFAALGIDRLIDYLRGSGVDR